jgi:hypothetical protein
VWQRGGLAPEIAPAGVGPGAAGINDPAFSPVARKYLRGLNQGDDAAGGAGTRFLSFTQGNFRENLARLTGGIPEGAQAHHVFPVRFEAQFSRAGINIHDPRFGAWWEAGAHGRAATAYNKAWERFFELNPSPTSEQLLQFGREIGGRYGLTLGF